MRLRHPEARPTDRPGRCDRTGTVVGKRRVLPDSKTAGRRQRAVPSEAHRCWLGPRRGSPHRPALCRRSASAHGDGRAKAQPRPSHPPSFDRAHPVRDRRLPRLDVPRDGAAIPKLAGAEACARGTRAPPDQLGSAGESSRCYSQRRGRCSIPAIRRHTSATHLGDTPPQLIIEVAEVPGELVEDQHQAERGVLVLDARVAVEDGRSRSRRAACSTMARSS